MKKLEVGKDYISEDGLIVIDRLGDFGNRGLDGNIFDYDLFCSSPNEWREATKEEVIEAFKKHLINRYGKDWGTMKIKKEHPLSFLGKNVGLWNVKIVKEKDSWNVWNKNGLLYRNGIWVERLEEKELKKIHIKEALKENTVIHCETEEEAERILGMAHELGYKWVDSESYVGDTRWDVEKSKTYYYLFKGSYGNYDYIKERNYTIIPSTQIADFEKKKTTDWVPAPEDIEEKAIEKLPIDKVTTKNLDIALRMVGIQLDIDIIDKVIGLVELIENKGDNVTIKDIVSLQQTW